MTKKTGKIALDSEACKGCYLCISVCPKKLIVVSGKLNQKGYYPAKFTEAGTEGTDTNIDAKCTGCATCATICPDIAIEVYRD